jgi:hypothetical protein
MAAPTIEKLRQMSDEDLIKTHDSMVGNVQLGISYYVEELARRSATRQNDVLLKYTKWITIMTVVVTIATIVNLWVAFRLLH